ncbi:FHA domain/GGDEF domain protein [Methylocaldum marinum]|uniref:diguanylate cyclase n=1 Tax=Methylocaldum marinum TaxID=1432792 RepID=A0A250KRV1_9GAMM|nr:GGDEF domain-containing protein [Methylocaldum marinum]BBA34413.1 FHA domain/GGDEF domain protein [Methylocaldum marinum]
MGKERSTEETTITRHPDRLWIERNSGRNDLEACLIMIRGPDVGRRIVLNRDEMVLGRSKSADAQIEESAVSRKHAIIRRRDSAFIIEDQNSKNGTFVNMKKTMVCVLRDQDLIGIGNTVFKFIADNSIERAYHEALHKQAILDPMLKIHNKKFFLEYLEQKCSGNPTSPPRFAIILFDIDHFKRINDSYGHQAGDQVLQHVAVTVKTHLRNTDIFSRYGGEEFAVALPDSNAQQAGITAEKLRRTVEDTVIEHDQREIKVTISLGVASFVPADAITGSPRDLIDCADTALYEAKNAGRNRVVVYPGDG